jgi:pyrimidine operon attenuation protein/uracil phosphoribosyltransferase
MPTNIPNDGIEGKDVILVDDVLYSAEPSGRHLMRLDKLADRKLYN